MYIVIYFFLFASYSLEMSKVCAIFGGSRGIGQATAQLLAQKGYCLAIVARNLDIAQTTAKNLGGIVTLFAFHTSEKKSQ